MYGVCFEDIPVQFDETIERPQMLIPPHVAPGAEEDSLGSFLYLIPKVREGDPHLHPYAHPRSLQ